MSSGVGPSSYSMGFVNSVSLDDGFYDGNGNRHPIPPAGSSSSSSSRGSFGATREISGGKHDSIENFGDIKISDLEVSTCSSSHGTITATKCKGESAEASQNITLTDCYFLFTTSIHGAIKWENSTLSDSSEITAINASEDVTLSNIKTSNLVKSIHSSVHATDCNLERVEASSEIHLTRTSALAIKSIHGTVTIRNEAFTRFPFCNISASGDITLTSVRSKEVHSFHASVTATNCELTLVHAVAHATFENTKVETLKLTLSKDLKGTITLAEGSSLDTLVICQPKQQPQYGSSSCIPAMLYQYGAKPGDSFFKMGGMTVGSDVEGGVGTIDGKRYIFTQGSYTLLEDYKKPTPHITVFKDPRAGAFSVQDENGSPLQLTINCQ